MFHYKLEELENSNAKKERIRPTSLLTKLKFITKRVFLVRISFIGLPPARLEL
jgi:hypothetical protein